MKYTSKEDVLNIVLTDIASLALDDDVANFAGKMAQTVSSVGGTFGQDPKDPAFIADKKKAVALANMYIKQRNSQKDDVEEDEAAFEETTATDPFDAYAESMDNVVEGGFNKDGSYNTSDDEANEFDEYEADDDELNVGDKVKKDGYPGIITKVHTGQLSGMVDVKTSGGTSTVSISDVDVTENSFKEENSKPDFLDIDGDGDKKEPMKKAVKDKKKVEEGNFDSFESPKAVEEEDDMAWLRKAAGIGLGAKSNHGIHEGEEGYQITPRSLVAREMRKLQDLAKD